MRLAAQERREQLLEAARRLFSVQGFDGTTTREIAEEAGVNEAIIFRYFDNKEDLYWAVINERIRRSGRKQKLLEYLKSGLPEREVFAGIAELLLVRTSEDVALTRLLLFSGLRNPELSDQFFRTYMADVYELIADYIRMRMKEGRLRQIDPFVAARSFLGAITYHNLVQELFGGNRYQQFDPRILGGQIADIWINGIVAKPASITAGRIDGNGANY